MRLGLGNGIARLRTDATYRNDKRHQYRKRPAPHHLGLLMIVDFRKLVSSKPICKYLCGTSVACVVAHQHLPR